jgi:SOS-response transcriptional repressor LexA
VRSPAIRQPRRRPRRWASRSLPISSMKTARAAIPPRAERYARFFRVAPEWLLYGKNGTMAQPVELGPRLFVKGEVAAGLWKEAWEVPEDEWAMFTGRADVRAPLQKRFGLRVIGESMNEVYPPGTIIECVQYEQDEPIESGRRVVVLRTKLDGTVEATVKELVRSPEGIEWLVPRSTNPAYQAFRGDQPREPRHCQHRNRRHCRLVDQARMRRAALLVLLAAAGCSQNKAGCQRGVYAMPEKPAAQWTSDDHNLAVYSCLRSSADRPRRFARHSG